MIEKTWKNKGEKNETSPNKKQLSTDERLNNFSEGGIKAIILSIVLIILSTVLISNAAEILDMGTDRFSSKEVSQIKDFTIATYGICYGLILFIWIRLFRNLSNKV
jgi:prolipoprotein diacylglyceryltransferase